MQTAHLYIQAPDTLLAKLSDRDLVFCCILVCVEYVCVTMDALWQAQSLTSLAAV